jgi:type I restriction enzyme S subunit
MNQLPKGWAEATLMQLAGPDGLVTDGDWVESKDQDPRGQIRLTQLADIGDGKFLNKSARFLNTESAERLRCTFLKEGDLLIARMPDPLGRAYIFPGVGQPAVTAVDVFVWRPDDLGANARWLMHFINSPEVRATIQSEAGGTTRQRVAGGKLKELRLPVPPLAEQQRIVAKLDSLTSATARACAELDRLPSLISQYKQVVLSAAFSGRLTKEWRTAKGFPTPKLVELGTLVTDIRYGTAQKCYSEPHGIAVLRIPNISSGRIDLSNLKYADLEANSLAKLRLEIGDILVIRSNGSVELVGRPALISSSEAGLAYAGYLIRLRHNAEVIVPSFLTLMLQSPEVRRIIETGARSTSGVHNINSAELAALPIPRFEIAEQHEIARRIEAEFGWLDRVAQEHNNIMRLLPRLHQAILAKAFRGDLVPQDPNEEPASLLLDRVRAAPEQPPKRGQEIRVSATERIRIFGKGSLKADRREHDMNKTRKDVSPTHLCDIVKKSGGQIKAEALWRASEMQIDEFYKLLRDDVATRRLSESTDKASIVNAG